MCLCVWSFGAELFMRRDKDVVAALWSSSCDIQQCRHYTVVTVLMMPLRARISTTAINQKGGRIAKELKSLIAEDKEKAHRNRFEEVVSKMKADADLTQKIYTCVSKKLLSDEQQEEDPEFGSKLTRIDKIPKAFINTFLDSLAPQHPMSAASWKDATKKGGAELPFDLLCCVCRVEKKDFIGPSLKTEWQELFQKRHSECGGLYQHFAEAPFNPNTFFQQHGHYRLLPEKRSGGSLDEHIYTSLSCRGTTAPLPKSVRVTGKWTIKKNYSLDDATICDDDDFSFPAADCFKKVEV